MSIEELATMLGEQIMAERSDAWEQGYVAGASDAFAGECGEIPNPYRKVSA